ncbi:MAG TPA: APC family permease [Candidatus Brachybacterium merdigallinarum]|nr:APC family permease [Candidatus Brachybacterium merdigallinarum]
MAEIKRSLSFIQLLALGVAGVVGSSWIYTNSTFFDTYGAGGMIFGIALGGVLAAMVALAYSELTTLFPRAGGEVVYSYTVLGRRAGFLTGWMLIGAYISSTAFYVTAFGTLLGRITPAMEQMPLYTLNETPVTLPVLAAGIVLTLIIFAMNWFGVRLGAQIQVVMFAVMVIIGLALIAVGFGAGAPDNFLPPFREDQAPAQSILRMVVPGMTYVVGFGLVAVLAEDANLPPRRIGRTVLLTVVVAITFYCLVLLASAWILPWEETAGMELGTVDAFTRAGYPILGWGAFAIAILGLLTSFLGLFVATSRIIVSLARVNLLPRGLATIHESSGAPRNALLFVLAVTVILGLLGPGAMTWFLDTGGIYLGIVWVLVVATKYLLPRRYPGIRREYRAPGWAPILGAGGAVLVIVMALIPGTDMSLIWPGEYIVLVAWFVLGGILLLTSGRMGRDEALTELLGPYKAQLDQSLGSVPAGATGEPGASGRGRRRAEGGPAPEAGE